MKKFVIVLITLAVILSFIITHSIIISNLSQALTALSVSAYESALSNNWSDAENRIDEIESKWKQRRGWIYITIDANKIEEIENALYQSKKFAEQEEMPDFTDKITSFFNLIKQIPNQEGLDIKYLI